MITSFTNVAVGDRIFTVHEMTVAEVRQWLLDVENGTAVVDPVGEFVVSGCSVADLARMCHVHAAEFDAFRPSEIQPVVEAAKKLNPHFFQVREVVFAATVSIARQFLPPEISNETA